MQSKIIACLVVLNVALLATFILQAARPNAAIAQNGPPVRAGDYVMIPGEITGGSQAVVYVIDDQGYMTALTLDDNRGVIDYMPKLNLAQIFQQAVDSGQPNRQGTKPNSRR